MANALQTRAETKLEEFREHLKSDRVMAQIKQCVPSHVRADQIVRTLVNALQQNPDLLLKCTADSIGKCLIQAATYGLEIANGQLGHCYMVPYGDSAQLQLSYKGIKELVRRSGEGMIFMGEVREGDQFQDLGQDEKPLHVKDDSPNRHEAKVTHAYAYMKFRDGFVVSRVMSRNACISHRDRYSKQYKRAVSKGKEKDNHWHEDHDSFPKMCMKTCVHGLANDGDVPLSADLRSALTSDHEEPITVQAVERTQLTHQAEPKPEPLTMDMVETEAKNCKDMISADNKERDLQEQYPDQKQMIYDVMEVRRLAIAAVEEQR